MSELRALAQLGWELDRAIARGARPPARRPRLVALAVAGVLAAGGGAAVAAGLLPFGAPLRGPQPGEVPPRLAPTARSAVVAPIRVADPFGGDPWAIRVARTSSGGTCIAAAHVRAGRFGRVGSDGRFHELPLVGTGSCGDLRTDGVVFDVTVTRDAGRLVTIVSGASGDALERVSLSGHGDAAITQGAFLSVLPGDAMLRVRVVAHFKDGTTRTLYEPKGAPRG